MGGKEGGGGGVSFCPRFLQSSFCPRFLQSSTFMHIKIGSLEMKKKKIIKKKKKRKRAFPEFVVGLAQHSFPQSWFHKSLH